MDLLQKWASVPEIQMRQALWREFIEEASVEQLEALVEEAAILAESRELKGFLSFQAFVVLLEGDAGLRLKLRGYPLQSAESTLALLLQDQAPERVAELDELEIPPVFAHRETTLGERRSLARSFNRDLLARLACDSDPGVIQRLLQNPRITEADVIRLASRRPASAAILSTVFQHPRWIQSPRVAEALLQNPYTPALLAHGLLFMTQSALLHKIVQQNPQSRLAQLSRIRLKSRQKRAHSGLESEASDSSCAVFWLSED